MPPFASITRRDAALSASVVSSTYASPSARAPSWMASGRFAIQQIGDRGDGIPVPRCNRDAKDPVERAEVADDPHVASVDAENEPVIARENFQQPLASRRKTHRQRWRRTGRSGQNAHETDDVWTRRIAGETIVRQQPDDLPPLTNHDLGIEGKPACEFKAQL